jgi:hypothetical protein
MKGVNMKRTALAAVIALSSLSLFALDLTGTSFTQTGERSEDGKTLFVLADESGGELLLDAEAEPTPQRLSALQALVAEIRSWGEFQAIELRAVNMEDRLQVSAIPRSFLVEGVDLAPALPGGIQLSYKTATEYDFKVKSGKFVVRVSSVFTGKAELEAAALAAFKDPSAFIATRDPLYVQKRLDELFDRADALEAKAADFETRIAALEKVTFDLSSSDKEERTTRAEKDLAAIKDELSAFEAKAEDRSGQIEAQIAAQWEKAKPTLLAALNGGKPIKEEAVAKLVELKKADPTLDKKSAPKALKAAGFSLSGAEISAIFFVEFDER